MELHVDIDAKAFEEAIARKLEALDVKLRGALKASAVLVVSTAKRSSAFQDREGRLRGSFRADEPHLDENGDIAVELLAGSTEVSYAPYIEFGTKTITPRRPLTDAVKTHEESIGSLIETAFAEGLKA